MIKNLAVGGGSNRLLLIFALLLGLICAILVGVYLSGLNGNDDGAKPASATIPVVVAGQDIPALTTITAEMLVIKSVPADVVLPGVFRATDDVVGQTTQVAIVTGEQVLPTKVTSASGSIDTFGNDAPLSVIVPQGMRAFSIFLSKSAAAGGLVRAGDHVDIIQSWDTGATEEGVASSGQACVVLQDVEVLAIGTTLKQTTADGDINGLAAAGTNGDASQLTLAVTPAQTVDLAAYQKTISGDSVGQQFWVSLRPFSERGAVGDLPACSLNPITS